MQTSELYIGYSQEAGVVTVETYTIQWSIYRKCGTTEIQNKDAAQANTLHQFSVHSQYKESLNSHRYQVSALSR